MQAYRNDPTVKERLLTQLRADYAKGRIVQGRYWEVDEECGCLVGCATREPSGDGSRTHEAYEWMYHIPRQLSRLFDALFESLPLFEAQQFTLIIHESIQVGADLSLVVPQFICWLLNRAIKKCPDGKPKEMATTVLTMYERIIGGEIISPKDWHATQKEVYPTFLHAYDAEYAASGVAWESCSFDEERKAKWAAERAVCDLDMDQTLQYWREIRDQILFLVKGAPHGTSTGGSGESSE